MEAWRRTFRIGVVPLLSTENLEALRQGLVNDDTRLIQGATTTPPPLQCVQDWPVEGACLLGYCGVADLGGFGVATVGEVEAFFAQMCFEAGRLLGEPAGIRFLLNHFDEGQRDVVRAELLAEVELALKDRKESLDGYSQRSDCGGSDLRGALGRRLPAPPQ